MKAFVTSIGEPTTDLCVWSLERNGFEVVLIKDDSTLAEKLKKIYELADDNFLRVDADVIPTRHIKPDIQVGLDIWWAQFQCFDWFKQDVMNGGIQFIRKEAIPILRKHIDEAMNLERPETHVYRLPAFGNPRRCITVERIMGIHGYGQNDLERVKQTKERRGQADNYDFELAERLDALSN